MFLANENVPRPSILLLRNAGYEVVSIQEKFAGTDDNHVLQIAVAGNYTILTFDRDYGELIFRYQPVHPPAVVYFREKGSNPQFAAETLISILAEGTLKLENAFTVIEKENIRQRFYSR